MAVSILQGDPKLRVADARQRQQSVHLLDHAGGMSIPIPHHTWQPGHAMRRWNEILVYADDLQRLAVEDGNVAAGPQRDWTIAADPIELFARRKPSLSQLTVEEEIGLTYNPLRARARRAAAQGVANVGDIFAFGGPAIDRVISRAANYLE